MIGKLIGIVILLVVVYFAWDFMFADSDALERYERNLQKNIIHNDSPIRNEQQYNPYKDQYLTDKYQMQNIPSNLRPWNP